jgi:hypothetical protein
MEIRANDGFVPGGGPLMSGSWKPQESTEFKRPPLPLSFNVVAGPPPPNPEEEKALPRSPGEVPLVMHYAEPADTVMERVDFGEAAYDPETQLLRATGAPMYAHSEMSWTWTGSTNPYVTLRSSASSWDGMGWLDVQVNRDWGDNDWVQFD